MSTIKKLVTNVLVLSFIITPISYADQKKENFWDKPAHKALVITGAATCAVVVAVVVYGSKKKDTPLVTGGTALPVNKPARTPLVILDADNDIDLDGYGVGNRSIPMVVDLEMGTEWPAEDYDWQLEGDIQALNDSIDSIEGTD